MKWISQGCSQVDRNWKLWILIYFCKALMIIKVCVHLSIQANDINCI